MVVNIKEKSCVFDNGSIIGQDCFTNSSEFHALFIALLDCLLFFPICLIAGITQINLNDVSLFTTLVVITDTDFYSVYFIPHCDFDQFQLGSHF